MPPPGLRPGAEPRLALTPEASELTPYLRVPRGLVRQAGRALRQPLHEDDVPARLGEIGEPGQRTPAA